MFFIMINKYVAFCILFSYNYMFNMFKDSMAYYLFQHLHAVTFCTRLHIVLEVIEPSGKKKSLAKGFS